MEALAHQVEMALIVSLRFAPTLAFAPPFTLLRIPVTVRLLLALYLAAWMVYSHPAQIGALAQEGVSAALFASELLLGMTLAITLQVAFAALLTVGRAIDIQVGFGLAQVADPALRQQLPLVGTLFSYAAGAVFFLTSGPADLLAIWSRSIELVPPGAFAGADIGALLSFISGASVLAVGVGGSIILVLFLLDIAIAFMSRTLPQMNMLVLGFQVKTLALLVSLPFVFAVSGSLLLRLTRSAVETLPRLL